jgi:hypothetical protein
MEVRDLFYVAGNAFVPEGRVSSTARRGDKWMNQVNVGEMVNLKVTETGESFGVAVVVEKELVDFVDAIENASHNHTAFNPKNTSLHPSTALYRELTEAYGDDLKADEPFTILHIIRITGIDGVRTNQFSNAYKAIESENRYQIAKLGEEGQMRSLDEWLLYIRDYAEEAAHQSTRGDEEGAVHTLRKVATMAVVALEDNDAPQREGFPV